MLHTVFPVAIVLVFIEAQHYIKRTVERCGAVVKHRTRDREVPGSIPTNCKCCFLEQGLYPHCLVLVSTQEKRGPHGRLVLDY